MAIIYASKLWNPTGFNVERGRIYSYEAEGRWKDSRRVCDANGWSSPLFFLVNWSKRCPGANWFQLIGAVNKKKPFIILGKSGTFEAPASGEFFCFANDAPIMYFNNHGEVELRIWRIN